MLSDQINNCYNCDNTNEFLNEYKLNKKQYLTNLNQIEHNGTLIKSQIFNESIDSNSILNENKNLGIIFYFILLFLYKIKKKQTKKSILFY